MRAIMLVAVVIGVLLMPDAYAQDAGEAGIVVMTPEGIERECVALPERSISGEELLELSSFAADVDSRSLGTAVCRIGGVGCGADDCFCEYPSFWGYWTRDGNDDWDFSDVGMSDRTVRNGSLDGWSYGKDGKPAPAARITFDEVCDGAQAAAATPEVDEGVVPQQDYLPFVAIGGLLAVSGALLALRRRRPAP